MASRRTYGMAAFWVLSKLSEISNPKTRAHYDNDHIILRTNVALLPICYQSVTVTDVNVKGIHSCSLLGLAIKLTLHNVLMLPTFPYLNVDVPEIFQLIS